MAVQDVSLYISKHLVVKLEVVNNLIEFYRFSATLTLTNGGQEVLDRNSDWTIYFYNKAPFIIDSMNVSQTSALVADLQLKVTHLTGTLHQLEPTWQFKPLQPGESLVIPFISAPFLAARTDVEPNWFVVVPGMPPRIIESTRGETLDFVKDFDSSAKWKRCSSDLYNPFTASERYSYSHVADLQKPGSLVIPTPLKLSGALNQLIVISDDWIITADANVLSEAHYLADILKINVENSGRDTKIIKLQLGDVRVPDVENVNLNVEEAYSLRVTDSNTIDIVGTSAAGVFYGAVTLINLIDFTKKSVPCVDVVDAPRFSYRGLMVDVARNFVPKNELLKLIDEMSIYKLNKLHLHLSDDEGWRLEMAGLEELTSIGGKRGYFPDGDGLPAFLGSGPEPNNSGCGFYTVSDYRQILQHAAARHIEVIPEIDMPGHSYAAIHSMQYRSDKLTNDGRRHESGKYKLTEDEDESVYWSVQHVRGNSMNPCMESTYAFVEHVVKCLTDYHRDIAPLRSFHFGGDEVPKGAWEKSPACKKHLVEQDKKISASALKQLFIEKVSQIATKYELSLQGWEDAFYVEDKMVSRESFKVQHVVAHHWQNKGRNKFYRCHELANGDYEVVLSHATHLYFDHPEEPDPEERGLYWATRYTDTRKVFFYSPSNLLSSVDVDLMGKPIDKLKKCNDLHCPSLQKSNNIKGIQAQLWSETVRTTDHLHHMLFPRLLALAERAWHTASWERIDNDSRAAQQLNDWTLFANTLGHLELQKLESRGIKYRIPPPGAIVENGKLKTSASFPGLSVVYSVDDGTSWYPVIDDMTVPAGNVLLAVRSHGGRLSRRVHLNKSFT